MKAVMNVILFSALITGSATAFSGWNPDEAEEYDAKAQEAIATFKEKDPSVSI